MADQTDISIVGGGLAGTTLALALAGCGFRVALIEAATPEHQTAPDFDGRAYALALSCQRMYRALGLWDALDENAQPMLEIKVSDGRAGEGPSPFFMHLDMDEIEEGPLGYMVEDRHLRPVMLDAVAGEARISHLTGTRVVDQHPTETSIVIDLDDGRRLRSTLLVGCDGRRSPTAARAGIRRSGWDYGQTAIVCAIEHGLPHRGIAHQFFMPPGPLAILPLRGNVSSIVWSETHEEAARIIALDAAAFLDHLRPRFGDFLGDIALAGKRFSYPLNLSLAQSFVASRMALAGDAAHGIHPIAGQGLNAGLRDIAALTEVLAQARRRGEDIGRADVLARYQGWRRFDTATMALATDGFNKLFSNDDPGLRLIRDIGLGVAGKLPALRRAFIREAAGLTGDLPLLMQGLRP